MNMMDKDEVEAVLNVPNTTVGDVATRIPVVKSACESLGIDYCCGGSRNLLAELQDSTSRT